MKSHVLKKVKVRISSVMVCLLSVLGFTGVSAKTVFAEPIQPIFSVVSGMQKLTEGVFVSTGEYLKVNMGLIVSGKEAAIIDTGLAYEGYTPNEALRVKQYMEENNLKLKYIILTHRHIDHIGNLGMFEAVDAVTYDSNNTSDGQVINLGDKTFKFIRTNGHIYDEHMSVELVKENILFAGDVVVTNMPTAVGFGGNIKGLIPTLEMLRTKNYSIIVPGHGDIINPHETINMNLEYLKNVEKYVSKIIKNRGTLENALQIKLEDCTKYMQLMDPVDSQEIHRMSLETAYNEFLQGK